MTRRSMAERLQDGFESHPLTPHRPMPLTPPPDLRRGRGYQRFASVAGVVVFSMAAFVFTFLAVDGVWWNVESQAVCTITSSSHHPVYSKSGFLGTDWDLTTSCGNLQVTRNGERFPDAAAQHVAQSLHVGSTYRLYLRGWDGWPEPARAVIGAKRVG